MLPDVNAVGAVLDVVLDDDLVCRCCCRLTYGRDSFLLVDCLH
jgi:hypothetical protein